MSKRFVRELDQSLGIAVARRTYFREGEDWGKVATRVALGNSLLHPTGEDDRLEIEDAISSARFLTAGRHLQHGDITQPSKNLELLANCATACTSFLKFLLLLNGAGVGRNYSDDVMIIDWRDAPHLFCVLSKQHPDYKEFEGVNGSKVKIIAKEDLDSYPENPDLYHVVGDSREGWAKALELYETAAYQKRKHDYFVFDFSEVRRKGTPIHGMQDRPASGPIPLMYAFIHASQLKYQDNIKPWLQNMIVDHHMSVCVANGGARRSSRMAIKYWKDSDILEFINLKRNHPWLNSSNNSIGVDVEFWNNCNIPGCKANEVFLASTECVYNTGEPGFVSLDKLTSID